MQDGTAATAYLRNAILDQRRPPKVLPETWRSATSAARLLAQRSGNDGEQMREAAKTAKRLQRSVAFTA